MHFVLFMPPIGSHCRNTDDSSKVDTLVISDQTESHLSPRKSTGEGCSVRSKFNACCIGPPGLAGCPSLLGKHSGRVDNLLFIFGSQLPHLSA